MMERILPIKDITLAVRDKIYYGLSLHTMFNEDDGDIVGYKAQLFFNIKGGKLGCSVLVAVTEIDCDPNFKLEDDNIQEVYNQLIEKAWDEHKDYV